MAGWANVVLGWFDFTVLSGRATMRSSVLDFGRPPTRKDNNDAQEKRVSKFIINERNKGQECKPLFTLDLLT